MLILHIMLDSMHLIIIYSKLLLSGIAQILKESPV